ncbi:phosphate-repressible phosphate permease,putative [Trypanosoma brucei gambiense DAL972]|uniref:Phosphate transporter n=1 Tax=Trypanosoma brucei gambiense (strain MHOM/CI/86/DAL972) TaxID=679716 RepID=C9ZHT9_TRYB9|nr:phosphate-repressible phosphate permease,putative [Trypanosoma brucei gambiense DAL972]CBH08810.1 phosphate-repressible phosphate permease,putative [Trypanosoma brucei gambiense DAL972]|eukprot:XP_011771251.1 phosphate-repressible phosphate permease,putative [Trypanosoma brucei gambiense DAL972]
MVHPYLWVIIVGGIVSFLTGCGVGMNDLANSFGTTYGSRVLNLWQIVILASICEFVGAVSLGSEVTSTISGGIANPMTFANEPYVLMYGMMCALSATFIWLLFATMMSLPVSSTHSIAGAIIGFALVYGGFGAVSFAKKIDEFPYVTGVAPIIASWFISPVFAGAVAASLYALLRLVVLRPANSVNRALFALPLIVGVTFFLESFFVLFKGADSHLHWGPAKASWVAALIGLGAASTSAACIPLLRRRVRLITERAERERAETGMNTAPEISGDAGAISENAAGVGAAVEGPVDTANRIVPPSSEPTSDSPTAKENPANNASGLTTPGVVDEALKFDVQIYDERVEYVFRYLQVFTAACASFAHGANDVSNAIAPFSAMYSIYINQQVVEENDVPLWILVLGGAGLVVGLATLGVRIMRLLGERITKITPSRGFSAELSAALVVSLCSAFGIPVSSTHCITGAVVAISIMDCGFRKVRWMMVGKMYLGWIFTLLITAAISALLFAQGIYAPSLTSQ